MRANSRGIAVALALVAATAPAFAQATDQAATAEASTDPNQKKNLLERLREAILDARERVGGKERDEREIFDRLEEIDRVVGSLTRDFSRAKRQARHAHRQLREIRVREAVGAERLARTQAALARRAVALYKTGEVGPLRVLFSSDSMPELFSRVTVLRRLVAYDAELVERFVREQTELEAARQEARVRARRHEEAVEDLEARSIELGRERGVKRALLARVREDRTSERVLLVELERSARALEETLANLGDAPREAESRFADVDFAARRGSLPPPVDSSISQPFGRIVDDEYRTETFRKGVEFGAEVGDSVRSVAFGEVRYAGWFRGYGKIVILDHGNQYFTVSGHLAEIFVEVGDVLGEKATIGSVGETGSLTGPSLYFEVRRGSEPLDPGDWLSL